METDLHGWITRISHVLEILTNFHVLALFIINTTRSPKRALDSNASYSFTWRVYRLIELLAGLITPIAKK